MPSTSRALGLLKTMRFRKALRSPTAVHYAQPAKKKGNSLTVMKHRQSTSLRRKKKKVADGTTETGVHHSLRGQVQHALNLKGVGVAQDNAFHYAQPAKKKGNSLTVMKHRQSTSLRRKKKKVADLVDCLCFMTVKLFPFFLAGWA
jgi:Zn-finger nucleic acid-binding protein